MLESLFNKVGPANLLKRDSNAGVSCEILEIFKSTFFCRTPLVAASEQSSWKCFLKEPTRAALFLVYLTEFFMTIDEPYNNDLKISKSNEETKINLTIFAWDLGIGDRFIFRNKMTHTPEPASALKCR